MSDKPESTTSSQNSDSGSPEGSKRKPKITQAQWWRSEELGKKPHEILDGILKQIEDDQSSRYLAYREYERLFGSTVRHEGDDSLVSVATDELSQNELQNAVETLWAQVFKNKVVPACSTSEADWEEWDRAKSYSRWLEGAFDDAKVHEEATPQVGIFSLVHGTGIARVGWKEIDSKTAQITCWAVNPRYFAVDRLEAKHGKPRSIFFKDHVDRFTLWDMYSKDDDDFYGTIEERQDAIDHCTSNDDLELGTVNTTNCDMITIREAFHLPSGHDSDDGLHVIWIKGGTLMKRKFSWDCLPAAFLRFGVRMEGFYGESAVKRLAPTQKNLDKLNLKIDESQDVMGVPRIISQVGNGLKKQHVDDIPGGILEVNNIGSIRDWNAQCVTPELYADRDAAGPKMRRLLGVSDFEAQNEIPAKLREFSAPAMERLVEQGQAKHAMFHGEYEGFIVTLAELFMRQAEECQKMGYDVVVKGPSDSPIKSSIESLSFKDVHLDRSRMKLRVQPMSQMPQTFSGKVDAIVKLRTEAGLPIDAKTAFRMLEVPDLNATSDMILSSEEIIMKNLCHMSRTGEYTPPLPFDNLDLIVRLTTDYINSYRVRSDSDGYVIGLLAQYIDDAILFKKGFQNDPNAPPTMPSTVAAVGGLPGAPGVAPLGMPGMPPPGGPMPLPGPGVGPGMMPPGMPPGMPPPGGPMGLESGPPGMPPPMG